MGFGERVKDAWQALSRPENLSGIEAQSRDERGRFKTEAPARKTAALPSILTPYPRPGQATVPRPTAANLRRFAETPVARRAINLVKDRIASMDWQIRIRRGYDPAQVEDAHARSNALRQALEEPNQSDSFRTLFEQVLEDMLVGGFGAIEMKPTGDPDRPFKLYAVDGAAIQIDPRWDGERQHAALRLRHRPHRHRCSHAPARRRADVCAAQSPHLQRLRPGQGSRSPSSPSASSSAPTATPAASPRTPSSSTRSGSTRPRPTSTTASSAGGRTRSKAPAACPSSAAKRSPRSCASPAAPTPTSASQWQEFLIRMIANAFDLPPMLLGLEQRRQPVHRRRVRRRSLPERHRARRQAARRTHHARHLRQAARLARVRVRLQRRSKPATSRRRSPSRSSCSTPASSPSRRSGPCAASRLSPPRP